MVQDVAVAAADLYKKLDSGTYQDRSGKRRKIDGDTSKLLEADGITPIQRRLLADVRFRTRLVPGTQEIRKKIGRIGFWVTIVYGNDIFMTVSPSERHNYLAIRLSRYRSQDPYVCSNPASSRTLDERTEHDRVREERKWIGEDAPSLEACEEDIFEFEIPGYDIRRLILARDPLCAANAFGIYIRNVLGPVLGVRMCSCRFCINSLGTPFPMQSLPLMRLQPCAIVSIITVAVNKITVPIFAPPPSQLRSQ